MSKKNQGSANRKVASAASDGGTASKNLEDQLWYHGYRPRVDAERLLQMSGEYLVRVTGVATTELIVSVCNDGNEKQHIRLKLENQKWRLGVSKKSMHQFDTFVELIEFYQKQPFKKKVDPTKRIKLTLPISRPDTDIKHDRIVYDPAKDLLGSGNFCSVFKGVYNAPGAPPKMVAVKISHQVDKTQAKQSEAEAEAIKKNREEMLREAKIMGKFVHENVIQFIGVACSRLPLMVVIEYCGALLDHLEKRGHLVGLPERLIYCLEAARGMTYLHKQHCVHRDLAARNCLISDKGVVKIADFGLSKAVSELKEDANPLGAAIPLRWMAPESICRSPVYSPASDVWSFGVLLYEIFSNGGKPFANEKEHKKIAHEIRRGCPSFQRPRQKCSADLSKKKLVDPSKRASIKEVKSPIRKLVSSQPAPKADELAVNKIDGVKRDSAKIDDTNDIDESSGSNDEPDEFTETSNSRKDPVTIEK